jgi:hypothetical protein
MLTEFDAWHIMKDKVSQFDFYSFLENDILIEDPFVFLNYNVLMMHLKG